MQVAVEKLSPVLLELAIEVDAGRVTSELSKAYNQLAKTARIRGFRPGRAPRKVLAHVYGERVARDVAQRLVDETYQEALQKQNVQAVSQPAIETQQVKDNSPFSYKVRVEIVPDIETVKFEGFEVERPSTEPTEEALEAELLSLRRANSTLEPPTEERPAQAGDVITIDFDVLVNGEVVADAGARGFDAELGAGSFLPEIEEGLLGCKLSEQKDVTVRIPATHRHPVLRGQEAVFRVTVKELKARLLPEADDEFAKDLDYDTLDDLKQALRSDLEKRLKEDADNAVAISLVNALVEANPIEIPPSLVRQQNEVTEKETIAQARAQGVNLSRLTDRQRAQIQADSENKVRAGLLMAAIAKGQGIKIGDKEIEEGIAELAEQSNKNVARVRAEYRDPRKREMLIGMILENKVLDLIESKATIRDASGAALKSESGGETKGSEQAPEPTSDTSAGDETGEDS